MMTDLQAMLMQQEGTGPYLDGRFFPYVDAVGKMTIGYGRNLDAKGLSDAEVSMLLNADIADAIGDVRHCFSCYDQLSRARQLVVVSMAFNMGRERLSKFVRFIGAVHLGKWEEAAFEMLASKWATQVGMRATKLAEMMRNDTSEWV